MRQQIVVSGLGGQGVLYLARLLAETAIRIGAGVLTSETHGMARRGGVVVSHLKVGDFSSPLVRESRADGLIVLSAENFPLHRGFLSPSGWAVINAPRGGFDCEGENVRLVDALAASPARGDSHALNLVVLGYALSLMRPVENRGLLFCSADDVKSALRSRPGVGESRLEASMRALDIGIGLGKG